MEIFQERERETEIIENFLKEKGEKKEEKNLDFLSTQESSSFQQNLDFSTFLFLTRSRHYYTNFEHMKIFQKRERDN